MRYFYLIFLLTIVTVVGMAGFRGSRTRQPDIELFNDMQRMRTRPQSPSEFFADGRTSRVIPEGAIAHSGPYEFHGETVKINGAPVYPYEDAAINTGHVAGTTNFIDVNPLPITRELLDRGQERFQIYCMPCHGPDGDGKGITSKYAMAGMANFHEQKFVAMSDGEIFNTITLGKPPAYIMPAYGPIIPVMDRWAIISYVRVLQRSQLATVDDVPAPQRAQFKK